MTRRRACAQPRRCTSFRLRLWTRRLTGAIVFPQVQALEAEQATLERERPAPATRLVVASPDAFPTLDVDRQRAIVDALVGAVVVVKAEWRGSPWTPDRLEVVWRA